MGGEPEPWEECFDALPLNDAERGTAYVHIMNNDKMQALLGNKKNTLATCESAVRELLRIGQAGPPVAAFQIQLEEAVVRGLRRARLEEQEDKKQQLSITPSQATWSNMQEAANRRATPLVAGLMFKRAARGTSLPSFHWPRVASGDEDEVTGYPAARRWLQQHVCPSGVTAVLVDREAWLECKDDSQKLHLKRGKTDVLFVLDDWVSELCTPGASPANLLLGIVGQTELKTNATFKNNPNKVMAQAGVEHLSACSMVDQLLQHYPTCKEQGHVFVTMATDLSEHWGLFRLEAYNMVLVNMPPSGVQRSSPEFVQCATTQAKAYLEQAADRLRAIHDLMNKAPASDAGPSSRGGTGQGSAGYGSGQQPGAGSGPSAGAGSGTGAVSGPGPGAHGHTAQTQSHAHSSCLDRQGGAQRGAIARFQAMAAHALADDDAAREVGARHSAALVAFMQHPLGFKGLLGLDQPPSAICHPHLSELAEYPWSEHADLVRQSILSNLG